MFQANLHRLKRIVRRVSGRGSYETLTVEQRRALWPPAKALGDRHLQNCRMLADREVMLEHMPKRATCAEVGILHCEYSQKIADVTAPKKLHLIDINADFVRGARKTFAEKIDNGQVEVHLGNSPEVIRSMPDYYFDWLYIDGDHSYEGTRTDLEAALPKLKAEGLLALNDYIYFESSGLSKYGVVEAVNEFCIEQDMEFVYFALQGRMYNDVVLRRISVR